MSKAALIEMFERMVLCKDASLIGHYYHPDFMLLSNGEEQDYATFLAGHRRIYASAVRYAVRYDDDSWVEEPDRVAVRLWITVQRPGEAPTEFEVLAIAQWKDGRIHRLWELTRPDWTQVAAFAHYGDPAALWKA
ncbi:nuclear transport factor 2 family protein [Variovorax sp. OV329]|uniref:nuclear transport factor 2 family protein n=1 Tax=Variovorax sp. OV329 TaxID=1882825 RepID=UPI0008E8ABB7|nr:nuclear transport factor 2 family protein [Variovorax sp. OV329]SFM92201.1 hypothetical protein SAMN05444747_11145 [Variovorax sp. OV329]